MTSLGTLGNSIAVAAQLLGFVRLCETRNVKFADSANATAGNVVGTRQARRQRASVKSNMAGDEVPASASRTVRR